MEALQKIFHPKCFTGLMKLSWANNGPTINCLPVFLGCIRRDRYITVLYKQKSNTVTGEFLGRLVLGVEGEMIKVFGATIY